MELNVLMSEITLILIDRQVTILLLNNDNILDTAVQDGKFHTWLHDYQGNIVAVVVGDSVAQHNSYYPYGLPHATLSIRTNVTTNPPNTYKYSGKEFDTFGGTDLYDFHARYHAPSTGRFMTVDPMAEKYPGISPYMYCAGNPIAYIDPDGMQIFVNIDNMIYYYREIEKGEYWLVDEDGNEYQGVNNFAIAVVKALDTLREGSVGSELVETLINIDENIGIVYSNDNYFDVKTDSSGESKYTIGWNPNRDFGGPSFLENGNVTDYRPSFIGLGHELGHGFDKFLGAWDQRTWFSYNGHVVDRTDIYACHVENMLRAEHGIPLRTHYLPTVPLSQCVIGGTSLYFRPFQYNTIKFF